MPVVAKDIIGKIIDFLREKGGETEVGLAWAAKQFNSHPGTISRALRRLIELGIIKKMAEPDLTGTKRPARYALIDEFKEDDGWREALKRKSSGKSQAEPSVVLQPPERSIQAETPTLSGECQNEGCLKNRKIHLEDLIRVYETLKASQGENRLLHSTVVKLQEELKKLREELENLRSGAEKRKKVCLELRGDVEKLESRLLTLRNQTSQPPIVAGAAGRKLRFDGSGAVILPNEGLPDSR